MNHIAFRLSLPETKLLEREAYKRPGKSLSLVAKEILVTSLTSEELTYIVTTLEELHQEMTQLNDRVEELHKEFKKAVTEANE